MSKLVATMKKMKANNLSGMSIHNDRKTSKHSNPDIDTSRSKLNYDLVNKDKLSYQKIIMDYINENKATTRAVRKDAVVVDEWIISSDRDFFADMSNREQWRFFRTAVNWFQNRYGKSNIRYASVHLDETTPHMHLGVVPLTKDRRLSSKKVFNVTELKNVQEKLPEYLQSKGFELERGVRNTRQKHLDPAEYKAKQDEITEALVEMLEPAQYDERGWVDNWVEQDSLRAEINELGKKKFWEGMRQRYFDEELELSKVRQERQQAEQELSKIRDELKEIEEHTSRLKAENERLSVENQNMINNTRHVENTLKGVLSDENIIPKEDEPVYYFDGLKPPVFLGSVREFIEMSKEKFYKYISKGNEQYNNTDYGNDIKKFTLAAVEHLDQWKKELLGYCENLHDKVLSGVGSVKALFINPSEFNLRFEERIFSDYILRRKSFKSESLKNFDPVQEGKNVATHYIQQERGKQIR
ncbi:hypothetical protein SN811_00590 [Ligilactobacillus agilis]|uniref:Plasmid recombination enzyme n=1 Tax=Ligilactobacillus agilis TaxID=1601 RepID=A0A6F9Y213_9LACO|nr:MobV family relaxase [Ligilactobacillus agilis]GET11559.1 hypothetical protein SN811_00590 [Ligilactobacillus agilis]